MFNLSKKKKSNKPQIDLIQSFGKLELKDGDIVIIKHPGQLSQKSYQGFTEAFKNIFGKWGLTNHVLILDSGADIGILRPVNTEKEQSEGQQ